ncbi:MAG TPA: cysteine--1-D-myo-inosityl 2-amino-2-deoxy-alpha-D-glucopyranoside ligase [Aeromicrobium sp.]|nr:cysteine--1-D-myo-inosityl 2-amino-2-deoxy-alpha-D-glucopyranoside ligase [Aeromicrobium sp.]
MRSWARVAVPRIAGEAPPLWLSGSGSVAGAPTGAARLYVCGITPYDATHLGHAATYLAFDLLQRQWLDRGIDVDYVQNVTDVDDPLLARAASTGVEWSELAAAQAERFRTDMTALRIVPPREWCSVTESMTDIIDLIEMLGDAAYLVEHDVYFDIDGWLGTQLEERTMLSLFAEHGGDPDRPGKRNPLDCLLWRAARAAEPSWESPWGPGRPGWHIECAAIAHARLGPAIDVIGGGSDLAFPHHAMSAAETAAATGGPAARTYLHTGMVAYAGAKMAKSDGNLVLVGDLLDAGHDPMAIRLALLGHHYREDWEWHDGELAAAEQRLAQWRSGIEEESPDAALVGDGLVGEVRARLADDLDAPGALAVIDDWRGPLPAEAIDALLGVRL